MVDFVVTYESNLEVGQYIQPCNCADAHIQVVPSYERDAALIPFAATLSPLGRSGILDDSGGEVEAWRTQKHSVQTYNLDVRPAIGTTHHDYRDVPLDETFQHRLSLRVNQTAEVKVQVSRKDSVIYDIPYNFKVDDDLTANSGEPGVESALLAALTNDISDWPDLITASANRFAVPKVLVLSIAVMETTHGWYDEPLEWIGLNKSIRPMNINVDYWPDLFTEENMYDPAQNFDAGAFMLKRIMERLAPNDRSIRKIATLYNNVNAAAVNDYGARVDYFVRTLRPDWLSTPAASRVGTP
ncbi:hypothetical protein [Tritonibacter mobilis]|uniref:hypothetical protein n=1 Tax=Tritonibacter mobilis TaxID=379347 RepID=UPI0008069FBD|nr:hypothetical protein [Tritonibacter mobilis]